jgi:hypothetical protein
MAKSTQSRQPGCLTPPLNPLPEFEEGTSKTALGTATPLSPGGTEYRVFGGREAGGEGENSDHNTNP